MTLKSHDLAHIRSVVLAGHAGSGKTTLAEQVLFRAGAIPRLGRVDDGTAHLDYEPEEQKQHRSLSLAVGTFEHGEHEITVVDTPGYPDFVAEMIQGFHAADAALFVVDASGGIESGLEAAVKTGRATSDGGLLRAQQVRPRERGPGRRPRRAARGVRQQDRPAPPRHRRRGHLQRLRRPRPPQGLPVRGRQGGRDPGPGRARRRGREAPRPAARGRGRGGRRRVREVPRRGGDLATPSSTPASTRASASRSWRPVLVASADQGDRPRRAARRDRPLPPVARRGGPVRGDRTRPARTSASRRTAASSWSACSRPPPTRSSAG